jgi:predicted permease
VPRSSDGFRRVFRLPASLRQIDRDIDDELRFHLESRIADLVARGMSRDDARRVAAREYGNIDASRSELKVVDRRIVKRSRVLEILDALRHDLRYALRGLRRQPVLTATIVITLSLGVGANGAVFSVLNRLFIQPPPGLDDPGELRRIYAHNYSKQRSWYGPDGHVTPLMKTPDLVALDNAARGTARIGGDYLYYRGKLEPDDKQVLITYTSPGYFDLLGVRAARGRLFSADEDRPGTRAPVAVISDAFWQRHFLGNSNALGQTLRVDGTTYTIVGIAPREFEGLELDVVDFWTPMSNAAGGWNKQDAIRLIARVAPGRSDGALEQMLTAAYRREHAGDPDVEDSSSIIVAPILAARGPAAAGNLLTPRMSVRNKSLLTRLAGVGFVVLLIAIANVASLLLMRALRRSREIAIRLALGVSRRRLLAQLAIESALLALLAGGAALFIAMLASKALRLRLAGSVRWTDAIVDQRLVLFALATSVAAGIAAGLAPAVTALRTDVTRALKSTSGGSTRAGSALRTGLLVAQSGLCMALLACSGVFLQSLRRAGAFNRGFDADHAIRLTLPAHRPTAEDEITRVVDLLRRTSGVEAAGRACGDLSQDCLFSKIGRSGFDTVGVGPRGPVVDFVEPGFMSASGFHAVAGRTLNTSDNARPVIVLTHSLADSLFHGKPAVGQCVHIREPRSSCREIVGVIDDVQWDVTKPAPLNAYVPFAQAWPRPPAALLPNYVMLRTTMVASAANLARLRATLAPTLSHPGELSLTPVTTLLEPQLAPWRLAATLFLALGLLGLIAAAAGIYGLISYDVTQRSRELGIRLTLGAQPASIFRLVVSGGLAVIAKGVAAGVIAAVIVGRLMASLLFATSPYDPGSLAIAAVTLGATAVLASVIPAWHAVRVDPMRVLSSE